MVKYLVLYSKLEGRKCGAEGAQLQRRNERAAAQVTGWLHSNLGDLSPAWSPRRGPSGDEGVRGWGPAPASQEGPAGVSDDQRGLTLSASEFPHQPSGAVMAHLCFGLWRFSKIYVNCAAHERRALNQKPRFFYYIRLKHMMLWIS